jgi:hypothetical protein
MRVWSHKRCRACKKILSGKRFRKQSNNPSGLASACKRCEKNENEQNTGCGDAHG